jgi:hypothetical protein
MVRGVSPAFKLRVEIQMSGKYPLAKTRQTDAEIDLQDLFKEYWSSEKNNFIVLSQSYSQTSPLVSDSEAQRTSLSMERTTSTVGP